MRNYIIFSSGPDSVYTFGNGFSDLGSDSNNGGVEMADTVESPNISFGGGALLNALNVNNQSLVNAIKGQKLDIDTQPIVNALLKSVTGSEKISNVLGKLASDHITDPNTGYYAKKKEHLDYAKEGGSQTDSLGKKIIPREAKSLKDAEQGIEEQRTNSIDHGDLLDAVASVSDSILDDNLLSKIANQFKNIDFDKLDNLVKNDSEFNDSLGE